MKHVNTETLTTQLLEELEKLGLTNSSLKDYKYCGMGPIIKHFGLLGSSEYSTNEVEIYIENLRKHYENGEISRWKWSIVRKSAALLEEFYKSGTVTLAPLPKWEAVHNPLHQKPSEIQLKDNDNIFALVYRVKKELSLFGLSQKTLSNYTYEGFDAILQYFIEQELTSYSKVVLDGLVTEVRSRYEEHQLCRSNYQNIRKTSALLEEYHDTGGLEWHYLPAWETKKLTPLFSQQLDNYCEANRKNHLLSNSTIATSKSSIRQLLFCIEDMGIYDFHLITRLILNDCIPILAPRYSCGMKTFLSAIQSFLGFLHQQGLINEELNMSLPKTAAPRRVIRHGFTPEELNKLLTATDRKSTIGKRDYAMMLLAIQSGLRVIDIVNLTFRCINWNKLELNVIQHKTGKSLCIPIEAEIGNALADYILNDRPQCNCSFVFLTKTPPYRKLQSRSASSMGHRYIQKCEIACSEIPRRGFHSFRRSFGARLLQSEIPLELLSEMLGHSSIDSSKPYIAIDIEGLRKCAIGLSEIEVKVGELQC